MNNSIILNGSILSGSDLTNEYNSRSKAFIEKSIPKGQDIPNGWFEHPSNYRKRIIIRRYRDATEELDADVFKLLHGFGIEHMSSSDFDIAIDCPEYNRDTKPINLIAVDDDVVFVFFYLAQSDKDNIMLRMSDYLLYIDSIKGHIIVSLNKVLKINKPKWVWVLATSNVKWHHDDKADANNRKIRIWTEYERLALMELTNVAGQGAKYQLYNLLFAGENIANMRVEVPAVKGKMGPYSYYSFIIDPEHLLKIAYVNRRTIEESDLMNINVTYQRMLEPGRVRNISHYIEEGGFFPGNIIINFKLDGKKHKLEESVITKKKDDIYNKAGIHVLLKLPPYYGCAWVIDGQHRLYGYANIKEKKTATIPVVAFVNLPEKEQAKIFVDINKYQKSVSPNVLWDLYEDLYVDSDEDSKQLLCAISKIAKELNKRYNSPFKGHIEIPKGKKDKEVVNITLEAICRNIKEHKLIDRKERSLFCNSYDETIEYATSRIITFFNVLKNEMTNEWEAGDKHYIRTKASMPVLFGILRDTITCSEEKEIDNMNMFKDRVETVLTPVIVKLLEAEKNQIDNYRASGGAKQNARLVRAEFTKMIIDSGVRFASKMLEDITKSLEAEKAQELMFNEKKFTKFISKEEDVDLEFKGSIEININRYIAKDGDGKFERDDAVLFEAMEAITAFLNTGGGKLVIGILEENRFGKDVINEKFVGYPIVQKKIIFGIDKEMGEGGWDAFKLKVGDLIESRITPDVLKSRLIEIKKNDYKGKTLCIIDVRKSGFKCFLKEGKDKKFPIRTGNKTLILRADEIDQYWQNRK